MSPEGGAQRSPFETVEAGRAGHEELSGKRVLVTDKHDRTGPELRIRSERTARIVAGALVVALAYGVFRWAHTAWDLLEPCANFEVGTSGRCSEPPAMLRWLQLTVAIPGVVVGAAVIGYFGWFAATGKIWRRRREVAIVLTALVAAWLAVYAVGILNV